MKQVFLSVILFILANQIIAQDAAELNSSYKEVDATKVKNLDFRIESLSFFLNNEYMGDIVDGYTWTGAWFRPKLVYTFSDKLKMEAGGHFLRYHSRDNFTISRPWFSAQYRMNEKLSVIFGNLNQNSNHGLLKQLWEPERILTDAPEEGIQFLYKSKYMNLQAWSSWEQLILRNDPFQEHFTIGVSGDVQIYSNSNLRVSIPLQALAYHKGGEIDSSSLGVVTHYNYATGLKLGFDTGNDFFRKVDFNTFWLGYKCPDGPEPLLYSKGHALSIVVSTETQWGNFSLDYWNGYQFVSPFGKKIFLSVSDNDLLLSQDDRSMLAFNYSLKKQIVPDVHFALQGEAFYDLLNSDFSFGFGFYLLINHDFFLKKI
ncbi:MAG: hypothetical protein A2W90_11090 [Bacteroidetes bacterium GWF2_42_66]|nr:MAG: hypothetical protein A2W92_10080 [Bacteroidetes bacterium GWA2_42_15]OFY01877.1 MAG: hypothetical protein A2W89_23480 [Bacteroidetes bacterium GWE2_42_39]OFY44827.1 MAG: hypothetical protein A2W90_11090 [Bacteroidetes bacterium GWF2_42_66]HBL75953.1 hypothetical protein [Prolixibacteraceae bacterium]HCR89760.1 hypothetical protein [Prolixibacteraceae bacterium]